MGAAGRPASFFGIYEVLGKSHERKQYRFPVRLKGELHRGGYVGEVLKVQVENLSITGTSLTLDHKYLADDNSKFLLHIYTDSQKLIVMEIGKIHRQGMIRRIELEFCRYGLQGRRLVLIKDTGIKGTSEERVIHAKKYIGKRRFL